MEALAKELLLAAGGIVEASAALQQKCLSLSDELGVYGDEIADIIHANVNSVKTHKDDLALLAQTAKQKAGEIQALLSFDTTSAGGASSNAGSRTSEGGGKNQAEMIRTYSQAWSQQLSSGQRSAIRDYTKESPPMYRNINGVLRGKEAHFDEGNYERSELLHSALVRTSTPCDLTLYRGGSNAILGNLAFASDDELLNHSFQDMGFCSTSLSQGGAFFSDVLMVIHLPAGSHAANIENLSAAGAYEQEVLIDRGCRFYITDVYRDEHGRRVVEAFAENSL